MRSTKRSLATILLACSPLLAQVTLHERLHDALVLEQQGRFGEALVAAKSVTDSSQLGGIELGQACIMLGAAYRFEGKFIEAQVAFERALRILGGDPKNASDYASALDNYAGLYSDIGQLQVAAPMWTKALYLRRQTGDHAPVARSLTTLAGLALARNRVHEAQQYLKRASDEIKLTRDLTDDDLVVLFETQGWLAMVQRHPSTAVSGYQRALELCKRAHGEQSWLTGSEYMLRGQAYAQSGDMRKALCDMREGLAILDRAVGRKNSKYFVAQIAYAHALDRTGSHAEAAQLKAAAEQARKDLYGSQCVACTINLAAVQ
jgi:tetratricopeptide (TPR) repeat protein